MSQVLVQEYLNHLADIRKVSGTNRESVVREAFKDLLKRCARLHDLVFVAEYEIQTPAKERRYVDGALLHSLRVPFGYWEAKDEKDDLDAEIQTKLRRGYPQDNIIFEDSTQAVLFQNRKEVLRAPVEDVAALDRLLRLFFEYERPEVSQFRHAVEQFKSDLPSVLSALRQMIERALQENDAFRTAGARFLEHAHEAINPKLTDADVREMLIQHILTEEIFSKIFGEDDFHRQNNVAKQLYKLEETFFTGDLKKRTLRGLDSYYSAIRSAAAQISSHHEKQTFLKVIYENFYKVYNPKAADRLGVIYTPNEIVRFMVESADWLCEKNFARNLIDKNVEILDPATGTGTFICELLEHFRGQPSKLRHKYLEELHANEVAILPYYVANLNIEATYAAIAGEYTEFSNLCFVDTLDNVGLHTAARHTTADIFGGVSEENVARIRRQNSRKISVIIGNPPYNANQLNENDNNKNREYPEIDKRIKHTYIEASTAQKTKLYDMYARFYRWASDRISDDGVIAFITNRSFVDSRTFDGFRRTVSEEFHEIWILDLGGDIRANPKLSGTKHNVFGIQTGVAICFLVKRRGPKGCRIFYARRPEMETAEEKLAFLGSHQLKDIHREEVHPDANHNWINLTSNDFDSLVPTGTKVAKVSRKSTPQKVVFKLFSQGLKTNRDEWVFDWSREGVADKVRFLIASYNRQLSELKTQVTEDNLNRLIRYDIKWTRKLKRLLLSRQPLKFDSSRIVEAVYRPFVKRFVYFSSDLNEDWYQLEQVFRAEPNPTIAFLCVFSSQPLAALAIDQPFDYCMLKKGNGGTECFPFFRYGENGEKVENITDWALAEFRKNYQPGRGKKARPISKEAIFHYVYAILHDALYRDTYAVNLRRQFPRIPLHDDFWQWSDWGESLFRLHLGFQSASCFAINREEKETNRAGRADVPPKCILKSLSNAGKIIIDSQTTLSEIPVQAWNYKIANRSALDWVLDQYREGRPRDATIREHFDTYKFVDQKETMIDLLCRVITVSLKTVEITDQIAARSVSMHS